MKRHMLSPSTPTPPDMKRLSLSVTPGIIEQVERTGPSGRMIRVRGLEDYAVSIEKPLRIWFRSVDKKLNLDETLSLMAADRHSIYFRHQQDDISQKAFERAWNALKQDPGNTAVEFDCTIERMMRSLNGPIKVLDIGKL